MLKKQKSMSLAASIIMMAILMITPTTSAGDSVKSFRQQNGLLAYAPPTWFLEGYFIARERNPSYVFGTVKNFVQAMGKTTTKSCPRKLPIGQLMRETKTLFA
jgi:hypothetical protein